jgi:pimeloyl-ACP methyl ester carboxylesterase
MSQPNGHFTSHFITAQDGLKLHARVYGTAVAGKLPVVCLAGLTRTCADFDALATALAADAGEPRLVVTMDSRGRGLSDYDRDAEHYSLAVELADVIALLTALEIGPAAFVGTSRGGILAMLLASARPNAIAGVVLNDIGPVIETKGLLRIKSYVGRLPQPKSYEEGAEFLRRLFVTHFPKLSADDWIAFAKRTFKERNGSLVPTYDLKIAKTLDGVDAQRPLPSLWKEFDALARMPVMVVRGANSDVLSTAGVAAMSARCPDLETLEVPDQGHAPLLMEDEVIRRLAAFIARCDGATRRPLVA